MEFREVAWRKALRSAEEGDVDAARRLLGHLAYYLKTGEPVPEPLAGFMATAAEAVATGASSAERAFKLTGPKRGRRPMTIAAQSLKYAVPATCSFLLEREGRNADFAIERTSRIRCHLKEQSSLKIGAGGALAPASLRRLTGWQDSEVEACTVGQVKAQSQ